MVNKIVALALSAALSTPVSGSSPPPLDVLLDEIETHRRVAQEQNRVFTMPLMNGYALVRYDSDGNGVADVFDIHPYLVHIEFSGDRAKVVATKLPATGTIYNRNQDRELNTFLGDVAIHHTLQGPRLVNYIGDTPGQKEL